MKSAPLIVAVALAACSHAPTAPTPQVEAPKPPPPAPVAAPAPAPQPAPVAAPAPSPADRLAAALPRDGLFFTFDSSTLSGESEKALADLGPLLAQSPGLGLRIEGNCDDRGTREYNLALGQRRADAAKKYLQQMGVKSDQLTTLSYGKERPRATGHDEDAWRQNRRDDLIPTAGQTR